MELKTGLRVLLLASVACSFAGPPSVSPMLPCALDGESPTSRFRTTTSPRLCNAASEPLTLQSVNYLGAPLLMWRLPGPSVVFCGADAAAVLLATIALAVASILKMTPRTSPQNTIHSKSQHMLVKKSRRKVGLFAMHNVTCFCLFYFFTYCQRLPVLILVWVRQNLHKWRRFFLTAYPCGQS